MGNRFKWRCAFVMVAMGLLLGGCRQPPPQMPQRPPSPVTVAVAAARDVPVYIDEIGRTMASEYVNIQPQVTGQVMERRFEDGADLKQGQILFIIDPRPFDADVKQAQANLEQAQAQERVAQSEFERYEKAYQTGAASRDDYDQRKLNRDTALAQVKVKQAALETSKLSLDYATIKSPLDGRAGQRQVDVGNIVKADDTMMLTIQRITPIYADFTITERDLPEVRNEMAKGQLKTFVSLPQSPNESREGNLTFLDTSVQPNAGRIRLRATVPNSDHYLWGGQFVNVRLVLRTLTGAVVVPYACTQVGQQGPFVFVVNGESKAEMRPVKLGQHQTGEGGPDEIVLLSGVKPGEQVVQTGQIAIGPGAPVRVVPQQTASTSTGPGSDTERPQGGQR